MTRSFLHICETSDPFESIQTFTPTYWSIVSWALIMIMSFYLHNSFSTFCTSFSSPFIDYGRWPWHRFAQPVRNSWNTPNQGWKYEIIYRQHTCRIHQQHMNYSNILVNILDKREQIKGQSICTTNSSQRKTSFKKLEGDPSCFKISLVKSSIRSFLQFTHYFAYAAISSALFIEFKHLSSFL